MDSQSGPDLLIQASLTTKLLNINDRRVCNKQKELSVSS